MQDFDVNHLFFWDPIAFGDSPFAINRVVILMWVASILCIAFLILGSRGRSLVPKRAQYLVETGYLFVRNNIAIDVIGPKDGPKYAHYLATLFFFIFFSNLLEILPGINFPVTSRMAIPAALAVLTWIVFNVVGIMKQGPLNYVKGIAFPPGVPKLIYILLTPIEILSTFIVRPFTLAIRLFANMVAGHTLLAIFFLFTNDFLRENISIASPFGLVTLLISCILIVFELLVISLQAYIFTMLTASYIGEAVHGHGDEHDGATETSSTSHKTQHETEGIAA